MREREPRASTIGIVVACVAGALGVASSTSSCRLLGLEGNACDPADATTCPEGQVCNAQGECKRAAEGEGEGAAGEGEGAGGDVTADNEVNVTLLVADVDGTLFWATGAAPGCVRRLDPGGSPENVACEASLPITGLTLGDDDIVWAADGAGVADFVRATPKNAAVTDAPTVLATGIDVAPLSRGPNALSSAKHSDGRESVLVAREAGDPDLTRIVRSPAGDASLVINYFDPLPNIVDNDTAAVMLPGEDAAFVGCNFDGSAGFAFRVVRGEETGGDFGLDGISDLTPAGNPQGRISAVVSLDDENANIAFGTVADDDSGALVKMSTGDVFNPVALAAQADPDNPRVHASAIASDGFFLYYATTGTLAAGKSRALFRVDLFDIDGAPQHLLDLDTDVGGLAIAGTNLFWTEPANNRIRQLPLPP